jgi:serine/threonine protein kinase
MGLENRLVLDRYRVLWRLEHKNLVKTYLGRDEQSEAPGTPVVVKQYLHDLGDPKRDVFRAFYDELEALKSLQHPGVVATLDYGMTEGSLTIVQEYVRGAGLSEICQHFERQEKPFPPRFAVFLARRILSDLAHCRGRDGAPVVHGRITLSAVYVQRTGEPKLADFGLASLEDVASEGEAQLGFFRTRMSFAAPEITRGEAPSRAGDAYSVALLLYRLLTGQNPFRGQSIPETVNLVMQHRPGALKIAGWPENERASLVLLKALDKDPAMRFTSPEELLAALRGLQPESDESVAAELAKIVELNVAADWEQIARLTRQVRLSRHPRPSHALSYLVESNSPAFVSGLVTQQPNFVSEHGARDLEQVRSQRRRSRWGAIPTVVLPAAAITLGLFLGRVNWQGDAPSLGPPTATAGVSSRAAVPTPLEEPAAPSQQPLASLGSLRAELRQCLLREAPRANRATVELDYDPRGQLEAVRLSPHELASTRAGACLLRTAWDQSIAGAGQVSVVIPVTTD